MKVAKRWKTNKWLNLQQELFCQTYVNPEKEFFGNGVNSYAEVYKPDKSKKNWYTNAAAQASEMLKKPNITARINELLTSEWLNDENIDKQLLYLINQFEDKNVKLNALKEYNKLKQRVIDRLPVQFNYDLTGKSLAEIEELRRTLLN